MLNKLAKICFFWEKGMRSLERSVSATLQSRQLYETYSRMSTKWKVENKQCSLQER